MLQLQDRVDPEVITLKVYSMLLRSPELESHSQVQFRILLRIPPTHFFRGGISLFLSHAQGVIGPWWMGTPQKYLPYNQVYIYPVPLPRAGCDTRSIVQLVWTQSFLSPRRIAQRRLKNSICPTVYLYLREDKRWINAFPSDINVN